MSDAPRAPRVPHPLLRERASGLLLPLASLPGPHGIGDLGAAARGFVDWLAAAGQRWWQMLPVGPLGGGSSPYSSTSSFAGEELHLDLADLAGAGWLDPGELEAPPGLAEGPVDFAGARAFKLPRLERAFARFCEQGGQERDDYRSFVLGAAPWLDDYARLAGGSEGYQRFCQFAFDRQWRALRAHAAARGVRLLGDLPIFVEPRSIDVSAHPELFRLDREGRPRVVTGVPPDIFAADGQLWGHPHYRWRVHRRTGFAWWIARIRAQLERFDLVRIDHFIAFQRAWEVRAGRSDALEGRYRPQPGRELLAALEADLSGPLPLVAEDLGLVTPEVRALAAEFGLPGMRVLQFAFGEPGNEHLPHRHPELSLAYTGTHDNDTAAGWLEHADPEARARALAYVGGPPERFAWGLVRAAWTSPAGIAIAPVQDVLGLGSSARSNTPGTVVGNWSWRLSPGALGDHQAWILRELTWAADRLR